MRNEVSVAACSGYEPGECRRALTEALAPFGGLNWVQPGMRVAIKANLLTFKRPESAATTHPALICALCSMLVERGAKVVVGDSPGGLYNAAYVHRIYAATGMNAVPEAGGSLNEDFGETDVSAPDAVEAKTFRCTKYLLEADAIIDFCKIKTHGLMGYTGACKNMFGAVPGTRKPEYHYMYPDHGRFADMLIDIYERLAPRICIADAVYGMEGNGPTNGSPRFIGAVLAAENGHALDLCGARLIGLNPADVPTLYAAQARGLIPDNVDGLKIYGDLDAFTVHDFRLIAKQDITGFGFMGKRLRSVVGGLLVSRPVPDGRCTGCAHCEQICPAKAITMVNARPDIDRKKCIRCFCCQEFCPAGAMVVKRPPVARLLDK